MNARAVTLPQQPLVKSSYNVLIEYQSEGKVKASVLGWPECQVEANTKAEALQQLQQIVTERLRDREIVSLEVEVPQPQQEHPWMKFAGKFFDSDREFEEFVADIQAYRKEIDNEMEEYYRQMDAAEEE